LIQKDSQIEQQLITEFSTIYHPGTSFNEEIETIESSKQPISQEKQTAKLYLKSTEYEVQPEIQNEGKHSSIFSILRKNQKESKASYPSNEIYNGQLEELNISNDFDSVPIQERIDNYELLRPNLEYKLTSQPLRKKEIIETTKISSYPPKSEKFEITDIIQKDSDVVQIPISESEKIESSKQPISQEKKTLKLYLKSTEYEVQPEVKQSIFSRLRKPQKESKLTYPSSEVYDGQLEELNISNDFDSTPIENSVDNYELLQLNYPSTSQPLNENKSTAKLYLRSSELVDERSKKSSELIDERIEKPKKSSSKITKRQKVELSTEPYTGILENLTREPETEPTNINEFVDQGSFLFYPSDFWF
jgi:hypothetical protein